MQKAKIFISGKNSIYVPEVAKKMETEMIESWDFRDADTKEYTHGFHTYPAMMIPQIARRLIELYGKNAKVLLDPFMGSGTSLIEASLTHQIEKAYGFDLNPLAVLIAKAKTTDLDTKILRKRLSDILSDSIQKTSTPEFKNINFWFKPKAIKRLSILKSKIEEIENDEIRNFFLVAFSETVRNVSNTRNSEFKLYRMAQEKLEKHDPKAFKEFEKIAIRNIESLEEYKKSKNGTKIFPVLSDTKNELPLESNSVDLIVTSPPYGDSRTTVAYGQFSRLALQWLDYEEVHTLDKRLLGGIITKDLEVNIDSPALKKTIKEIAEIDPKRAREVLSFYEDFDKCISEINRVMAKEGYICFVVGNRTVKGINIPTDQIMVEMFQAKGNYEYITTHYRNIPFKRMPKLNSPSNKKGEKVTTINKEFIFVLRKV